MVHPAPDAVTPQAPAVAPVVEISAAGDLVVRCPYCGQRHRHGSGGGLGLRTLHCGHDRPSGVSAMADYRLVDPACLVA